MPEIHLEILPRDQLHLWRMLQSRASGLERWDYYLAGGTALALQLGHRRSVDFDFFSPRSSLARPTHDWLTIFPAVVIREMDSQTIHTEIGKVKTSFISGYRYPLVRTKVKAGKISLASVMDLALMKLLAITHRATLRDYLDLAVILRDRIPLRQLLKASRKKYGKNFNVMIPIKALVAFDDIELEMPRLLDTSLKNSWKDVLIKAVKEVAS